MNVVPKLADFGSARRMPHGPTRRLGFNQRCVESSESDRLFFQSLHRQHAMTPGVCTAWYRAPELLSESMTPMLLDRPQDEHAPLVKYGAPMDVWSYGVAVYELLIGRQSARAAHGAGLLRALLQQLEVCPNPCFDAGCPADLPTHTRTCGWKSLDAAACAAS